MKLFRDLADSASFSRAAEMNAISQSAASQQIRRLEKELGISLVQHNKRPLVLTPAGQEFALACRDIVRRFEKMQASLEEFREEISGPVRVASIYSVGLYDLSRHAEEFHRLYPKADVHIEYLRTDKVYDAVLEDRVDVGLVSYPTPSKELRIIPWRREKMLVVTNPAHHLAKEKSISAEKLEGQPFICFDQDLQIRKVIDRFLRELRVTVQPVMVFDNIANIKEAVAMGAGISILPEPTVRHDVKEGRLCAITLEGSELVRTIDIIYRRSKVLTPATLRFVDVLRKEVRE